MPLFGGKALARALLFLPPLSFKQAPKKDLELLLELLSHREPYRRQMFAVIQDTTAFISCQLEHNILGSLG